MWDALVGLLGPELRDWLRRLGALGGLATLLFNLYVLLPVELRASARAAQRIEAVVEAQLTEALQAQLRAAQARGERGARRVHREGR